MAMFDTSQFDPRSYQPGANLLALLLGNGGQSPVLPPADPNASPWSTPTDLSSVNRNGTSGVTLPQTSASGFGRAPDASNPIASLFSGIGDAVGGLFGGGPQQAAPAQPGPQQAPQEAGPGIGDRLGAAAYNLSGSHGLLSGIANTITGLSSGTRTDQMGLFLQQQHATQEALIRSGVPVPIAQAAALNPEILKTIAPQLYTKPQLVDMGVDPLTGMKTQGTYNANTGQLTQLNPVRQGDTAGGMASGGTAPGMEAFSKAVNSGVTGEALYQYLPPTAQNTVRQIVEGRLNLSPMALRSPQMMPFLQAANAIDPSLDMMNPAARGAAIKDARAGSIADMQRGLNQAIHHVTTQLVPAMEDMGNTRFPAVNDLKNKFSAATGGGEITSFLPAAHAVADEMSRAFKGGHMSDSEIRAWEQTLTPNMSPVQQRAAVKSLLGLLNGAADAIGEKRLNGVGPVMHDRMGPIVHDQAQQEIEALQSWIKGDGAPGQAASKAAGVSRADLEAEARRRGLIK